MGYNFPILLSGSNLKERHHYLNSLVNQAYKENVTFKEIAFQPERSPIDRLFKIDLASKYTNVEYIIRNLKDDDMLYVSRSLKCLWLLEPEYLHIINPTYLENSLYPEMIQPAVNKMKYWIHKYLKDSERCKEFYNFYKNDIVESYHYLLHCSNDFIISEFPNIIHNLSPKQLKILFEVCPSTCKIYFEILPNNSAALAKYVDKRLDYFSNIKIVLKYDGNLFLDIVEQHFDCDSFRPFGSSVTQYIMKYYRSRFDTKSELYVSSLFDIATIAANLTDDQAKQLILRLACAEYLGHWFSYKKVEPLIKRLKPEDRISLKKKVFVDKLIGDKVKEWPYPIPKMIQIEGNDNKETIFTDLEHQIYYPFDYLECKSICLQSAPLCKRSIKKRTLKGDCDIISTGKSRLDQLFNRYRFIGFEQTFYELSKNLLAESTIDGRLNMMLVLVSKSGGIAKQVEKILKLLVERHRNETTTLRAAIVRSFVKRSCVWRLPDNIWDLLLEFGRDIGLDGAESDPICREGLHAVVIRHLLANSTIPSNVITGFLREFSTLSEYQLNKEEIKLIRIRLPMFILMLDANAFLDTLIQYKINIKDIPDAKPVLLKAARSNSALAARLYKAKVFRRELFHETFVITPNDAAFINALRHDTIPLENGKSFIKLATKERPKHDRFLKSLHIYFGEAGGLAEQHRIAMEETFLTTPNIWCARSLCCLLSNVQLLSVILKIESERPLSNIQVLMSAALRANSHKSKPSIDIDAFDWRWIGVKAVANKTLICRVNDREIYINKLMKWRRTARISMRLSLKTSTSVDTFLVFCSLRPLAAVKMAFSLFLTKDYVELPIWNAIKEIITKSDLSKNRSILKKLSNPSSISKNILPDYWMVVFMVFIKIDKKEAMPILGRLESVLPDVNHSFVRQNIKEFIEIELNPETFLSEDEDNNCIKNLYVRIIAKHLLLCKSEDEQKEVLENVFEPFFDAIEILSQKTETKKQLIDLLNNFSSSLKYNKVLLSNEYVSCLPIFERFLKKMHTIFSVEDYFGKYVEIHLTMLYYKTIKHVMKLKPNIFDKSTNHKDAVEIVGRIFGNYIGHEIKELIKKYFASIVDLYKVTLRKYLRDYYKYNESRQLFITYVIKGLLEVDTLEASILAEYVFNKEEYSIPDTHRCEILKALQESKHIEIKFFIHADVKMVSCMS